MRENVKCPFCSHRMTAISECGVEIDCCSHCSGIWLDSSELSTLLATCSFNPDNYLNGSQNSCGQHQCSHQPDRMSFAQSIFSQSGFHLSDISDANVDQPANSDDDWSSESIEVDGSFFCPCCIEPLRIGGFAEGVTVCPNCSGIFFDATVMKDLSRSNGRWATGRHEGQGSGLATALVSRLAGIAG